MHLIFIKSMETSTSTKLDVIIPLAIAAAAGFLFARATRRKDDLVLQDDIESVDSSYLSCLDSSPEPETYNYQHVHELEEEISVLRRSVRDLHARELELETRHLHYCDSKGHELMVMELEIMLLVEIARAQIMEMDESSETERRRFQNMFLEYQKILGLFQLSRSRNRMIRRRLKKMLRKNKDQREMIRELHEHIEAAKAENSRTREELGDKTEIIRKLEDEIRELKNDLANETTSLKTNAEMAAETEELIHLRWSNACLRHELMSKNQEEDHNPKQEEDHNPKPEEEVRFAEIGYFGSDLGGHSGCLNFPAAINHGAAAHHSRRKKLIKRLKRWVEGSDHKERHGYGGDEMHIIQGRKSCSSV